jgi:hypothetical protein
MSSAGFFSGMLVTVRLNCNSLCFGSSCFASFKICIGSSLADNKLFCASSANDVLTYDTSSY